MEIFTTKTGLSARLGELREQQHTIGFVATMGALHDGHLELVRLSKTACSVTVCSIFVNPTQFNNPEDLKNYPRTVEADKVKLESVGCDILFLPSREEMYDTAAPWHLDLGELEGMLEGEFRPGHYQGVTQIVKKLFDVVQPDLAFFGQKDFQQFKVIEKMVALLGLPVKLRMCPIVREPDGLAMSSRNIHLSPEERQHALALYTVLNRSKARFGEVSFDRLQRDAMNFLSSAGGVKPEYFALRDAATLEPAGEHTPHVVALVAAFVGKTRLIDNLILS
ncbi:pantoate--beta-alanine ligase [Hufsiella ginkgonis]|uniref:Pantothenate synthetase n=1 Tax=Hufsiella ginkgonis TaxID=2695274 RepID=A0A7K1XSI6_9SPHI|nr:pantoate--beta-alanine ligase [Hufsiella ginkgonis]MXV13965.1 pantoate--beta-alanine ligase [Hufsiella ginkgonis]